MVLVRALLTVSLNGRENELYSLSFKDTNLTMGGLCPHDLI